MADIAVVALGLDATGVQQGEKAAVAALQAVEKAMQQVEKSFATFNQKVHSQGTQAGEGFKKTTAGITGMGSALQGLGGPVGQFSGQIGNLVGQMQGLVSGFGLFGAGLVGIAAGALAAGAAIAALALDGVRLSDQLSDMAEGLGFTEDQMERLHAATRLSGEQMGFLERTFSTFQQTIQAAVVDPSSDAARALAQLGISGPKAAKDTQAAFLDLLPRLSGVTQSFTQMTAARELFGRGLGPLIRISQQFADVMGLTREQMVAMGLAVDTSTNQMAGAVDRRFNEILLMWDNLKRSLIIEVGPAFLQLGQDMVNGLRAAAPQIADFFKFVREQFRAAAEGMDAFTKATELGRQAAEADKDLLKRGTDVLGGSPGIRREIERGFTGERFLQGLPSLKAAVDKLGKAGGGPLPSNAAQGGIRSGFNIGQPFTLQQYQDSTAKGVETGFNKALAVPGKAGKGRAAIREITEFTPEQIGDPFKRYLDMIDRQEDEARATTEALKIKEAIFRSERLEQLAILSGRQERPAVFGPSPVQAGGPGQPFPGAPIFDRGPDAHKIRTEEQARIDEQFNAIFDNMLISVLTAQKSVGGAFADLAIGVVDQFAIEFTTAFRKSFITPVVEGLTNMLQEVLSGLFSGVSGKGAKGFFAGVFKGIGQIFGGIFGGGGTLGPGKFGIAGERGPELIFSGSQPMHIAPVTAGSAGNVFNINVGVNAPAGTVDRKTQDQLAAVVMQSVRRAQRNEGAR